MQILVSNGGNNLFPLAQAGFGPKGHLNDFPKMYCPAVRRLGNLLAAAKAIRDDERV
jgi:hypothetical protein